MQGEHKQPAVVLPNKWDAVQSACDLATRSFGDPLFWFISLENMPLSNGCPRKRKALAKNHELVSWYRENEILYGLAGARAITLLSAFGV